MLCAKERWKGDLLLPFPLFFSSPSSFSIFQQSLRRVPCVPKASVSPCFFLFGVRHLAKGKKSPARNRNAVSGFFFFLLNVTGALIAFGGGETVSCKFGDSRRNLFHIFFFASLSLSLSLRKFPFFFLPCVVGREEGQ